MLYGLVVPLPLVADNDHALSPGLVAVDVSAKLVDGVDEVLVRAVTRAGDAIVERFWVPR
ncbi:MAG TPA: hypothetical protein VN327_06880 [Pseudonocardiaceae bacterium]|jgi:hypothetical protein|nr:hypothetical protein [Pseudonocardiaceae bacterium]